MDSWKGHNYYTTNISRWVDLMNISTTDWGVGWLPPNIVAIPYALNDSIAARYPENTTFIENASKTTTGDRATEKIVFGVVSGLAILWAVVWLYYSLRTDRFEYRPINLGSSDTYGQAKSRRDSSSHGARENGSSQLMDVEEFKRNLMKFYSQIKTGLEYEDKPNNEDACIKGDDVEVVTNLLRTMYDLDLSIWSRQDIHAGENHEIHNAESRVRSNAIWAEVRKIVGKWEVGLTNGSMRLPPHEQENMADIVSLFGQYRKDRCSEDVVL
ncbi:hypothetical protein CKAH01_02932 [Colletotrichum kahawae]|uniref:Uncharacterized protein n=1 Tax=Colletotrichum kahawae TaxID=34407 RepID=A0AAE0DE22_COLKA|nr:hypothetical protein CKAH01_02932 [Colletotrichum kahawae]